ncbi:hypothetical protein D3C86_2256000 [compost metagenome]
MIACTDKFNFQIRRRLVKRKNGSGAVAAVENEHTALNGSYAVMILPEHIDDA